MNIKFLPKICFGEGYTRENFHMLHTLLSQALFTFDNEEIAYSKKSMVKK